VTGITLIWTVVLGSQFEPGNTGLQLQEHLPWIESLGLTYKLGLDGLSLPLVVK